MTSLDAIFVAQQLHDFLVEDLPGELIGLVQDYAAVFRVGVIAEIGAFVDEAATSGIDHDARGIGVFLEVVADAEIAEFRRIIVPADRVASRPIAIDVGTDVHRHLDAVATC